MADATDDNLQVVVARLTVGIAQLQQTIIDMEQRQQRELQRMERTVESLQETLERRYITTAQFDPIAKIVYGLLGLIVVTVIGAMLAQVVITP